MRAPRVCGVAGGVGTTTIAAALRAQDLGVYRGGPADVVVCRSTSTSLAVAHRVVNAVPGSPVLVVVADGPLRTPPVVTARVRMVEPHLTALVWMPYVPRWREIDQALEQAVAVPCHPRSSVPKWLRAWARALMQVADAVLPLVEREPFTPTASGVLTELPAHSARSTPPGAEKAMPAQRPGMAAASN